MKFGRIPIGDALGATLAHSERTRGGTIKKGRTLAAPDLAALRDAGLSHVTVARIEAGDIAEDRAAGDIARAIAGAGTTRTGAFTGRANLFAASDGLVVFQRVAIDALNGIDEGLTIATVQPWERVAPGQMIATIKVIPFALPEAVLTRAAAVADAARISVVAFRAHRAGLILTEVAASKANVLAKRRRAIADRLEALGSAVAEVRQVAHTAAAVAAAVRAQHTAGLAPILVFAASAIVDRADVVPAGVVAAGGRIVRLGMPVDPGNLLLLARLGETDVIGIPSCAGSPKLNGFDWVLQRVLAGCAPSAGDIGAMGVGGLLKEIESRPQPRIGTAVAIDGTERRAQRIAAIVLAAGRSTRMGVANKLTETLRGKPLVRHVAEAAAASGAAPLIVVTGHQADAVRGALAGLDVTFVHNPRFAEGMATSLQAGIAAAGGDVDGALVLLGDMPDVSAGDIGRLLAAFSPADGRAIVVPVRDGRRGNPVVWSAAFFGEIAGITGDGGAKALFARHADGIAEVEMGTDGVLRDIDTPAALADARAAADAKLD